ncbi:MAG: helix-turn-helix transcriptional regulator [Oscillospiraceae bacterium]|nr:helix-turn-helix transcriptional regulator [Oscillospiraceae bacterium]
MKWSELKTEINSLSQEEKAELELMDAIAFVRKQKHLTQEQLARKVNLTQAQVARVENLSYKPSLETLTKILGGLELDLALIDRATGEIVRV